MSLIKIHKTFWLRAQEIKNKRIRKFERDQKRAQKLFEYLNHDVFQESMNEKIKRAQEQCAEAFKKFADAIKQSKFYKEGGTRAGKTKLANEVFDDAMFQKANLKYQRNRCQIFGHELDMATGICSRCGFKFTP